MFTAIMATGIRMYNDEYPNQSIGELVISQQNSIYPEATGYVVDTTRELNPETVYNLNKRLENFDGTAQIAVAVINTTYPLSIEEYGIKLSEKWKVGYSGKDNGAIIILAIEDRNVRIEIGKGLEGILPDSVVGRILDEEMVPSLKNNDWDTAIIKGVTALQAKLSK